MIPFLVTLGIMAYQRISFSYVYTHMAKPNSTMRPTLPIYPHIPWVMLIVWEYVCCPDKLTLNNKISSIWTFCLDIFCSDLLRYQNNVYSIRYWFPESFNYIKLLTRTYDLFYPAWIIYLQMTMHYFINIYLRISQLMRRRTDVNKRHLVWRKYLSKITLDHLLSLTEFL